MIQIERRCISTCRLYTTTMEMAPSWLLNIACGPYKSIFLRRTIVNDPAPEGRAVLRDVSGDTTD
jgi:hypothetical protein